MKVCLSQLNKSHLLMGWLLFIACTVCMNSTTQAENSIDSLEMPSAHIRVLASSCAACHGTNGNSVSSSPVLAGLDKNHFILQMLAFRSGARAATVMHRHAKGLAVSEIEQLASYFLQQKRSPADMPQAQILDVSRE